MNIYKTAVMLEAIRQLAPRPTFLTNRYFKTNPTSDIFVTEEVWIDIKKGSQRLAPCVMPRKNGITIERDGFKTYRHTPPKIAPKRILTIDDLTARGFGEAVLSNMSPMQRQAEVLRQDLIELDAMIAGRVEQMAAQVLCTNAIVLKQYSDKISDEDSTEYELRFYDGVNDTTKYTPAISWSADNADILGDLKAMVRMLTQKGLPATDLLVAPDVADAILNNPTIQKLFDNRSYNLGSFAPTLSGDGASHIGKLNVYGHMLDIISYDAVYTDDDGKTKPYLGAGEVVLTYEDSGKCLYGAVSQIEVSDGPIITHAAARVPKYTSSIDNNIRTLSLTSRPLPIPRSADGWIHAKVITA